MSNAASPSPAPPPPPQRQLDPATQAFLNRPRDPHAHGGRLLDGMFRVKGAFTLLASLIMGIGGPIALSWSADMAAKSNATFPAFAVPFVNHPWLVGLIAIPAIVSGVFMCVTKRYRWAALFISTIAMLVVLVIVLAVFMRGLDAMYSDAMKPL